MTINAEKIMAEIEAAITRRAEHMPTEQDAIRTMFEAHQRLRELGWREGCYMPATGERFAGIQCGSTGIHAITAERRGPFDVMYTLYDGDIWPSKTPPAMFRPWAASDVQAEYRPTYLGMLDEEKQG